MILKFVCRLDLQGHDGVSVVAIRVNWIFWPKDTEEDELPWPSGIWNYGCTYTDRGCCARFLIGLSQDFLLSRIAKRRNREVEQGWGGVLCAKPTTSFRELSKVKKKLNQLSALRERESLELGRESRPSRIDRAHNIWATHSPAYTLYSGLSFQSAISRTEFTILIVAFRVPNHPCGALAFSGDISNALVHLCLQMIDGPCL
ncbi:hypothetical protein QBC35DRAFT_266981 [Podospora australis]|uniref:Uncharacterized protein n=1 Tax=Podospora australis TaxID=1536484 RepID=A0AAN6WQX2_9PEZI|nr:hypothetical protein QBC35DRAFT_266981 [Podospora australis]